jgi:hypothetical protein
MADTFALSLPTKATPGVAAFNAPFICDAPSIEQPVTEADMELSFATIFSTGAFCIIPVPEYSIEYDIEPAAVVTPFDMTVVPIAPGMQRLKIISIG